MLPSRCIFLPFESCFRVLSKVLISVCAITIVYITKKNPTDYVSYCTSGLGIFTSRKESENTAHDVMSMMCTLTSVYYQSHRKLCNCVSPYNRNLTQHPPSASILIRVHHSC